jgi:hypothetical protein
LIRKPIQGCCLRKKNPLDDLSVVHTEPSSLRLLAIVNLS